MRKLSQSMTGANIVAMAIAAAGLASTAHANENNDTSETAAVHESTSESTAVAVQMSADAPVEVMDDTTSRRDFLPSGGRLLLTGGVSTIEGAGGGGLVPWALIGGYGTRDQVGVSAYATGVDTKDFTLASYGAAFNIANRVELSVARQNFNLREVGNALNLGNRYTISQTILGAKVRLFGDAILEQDSLLPQVAVGVQYKINDDEGVVEGALGLEREGIDIYASATKLILSKSLLLNATVRLTKANQFSILGFGGLGGQNQDYEARFEGSVAYLLSRKFAVGGEYRTKSNRLEGALGGTSFREEDAWDIFAAYTLNRNVSLTVAYARLGQIALRRQDGAYASIQIGF